MRTVFECLCCLAILQPLFPFYLYPSSYTEGQVDTLQIQMMPVRLLLGMTVPKEPFLTAHGKVPVQLPVVDNEARVRMRTGSE